MSVTAGVWQAAEVSYGGRGREGLTGAAILYLNGALSRVRYIERMSSVMEAAVPPEDVREAGWAVIHESLLRLAQRRGDDDVEEARLLLVGLKRRIHEPLGFGSFLEYVERVLGYMPKQAVERIRVARAFADLPPLRDSVRRGELCWSAAREISRVAVPETVDAWIEECRDERMRDIERFVAGRKPGDLPTAPPDEAARTHVVRLEVQGEALALLREARTALTRDAGEHVSDERLVQLLARAVLEGGADPGRAAYQLAIHDCPSCERARAEGGGELVPVGATVAEMARCDAQVIQLDGAAPRAPAHPHVGAPSGPHAPFPPPRPRASQTIPPAVRRQIVRRHGGRCAVRGCRHAGFLHQHHTHRRADGGQHDPEHMCLLCEAHHRAVHDGYLVIDGTWSTGFRFFHADGTPYGRRRRRSLDSPTEDKALRQGWTAITRQNRLAAATRHLRSCGLPEHEASRLVRTVAEEMPDEDALPAVVDAALRRWSPAATAGTA